MGLPDYFLLSPFVNIGMIWKIKIQWYKSKIHFELDQSISRTPKNCQFNKLFFQILINSISLFMSISNFFKLCLYFFLRFTI